MYKELGIGNMDIAKLRKLFLSLPIILSLILSSCGGGGDSNAVKTQNAAGTATNASILFGSQLTAIAGTQAAESTPTKTPFQPLSATPTK
jgi:hypothetical protein